MAFSIESMRKISFYVPYLISRMNEGRKEDKMNSIARDIAVMEQNSMNTNVLMSCQTCIFHSYYEVSLLNLHSK